MSAVSSAASAVRRAAVLFVLCAAIAAAVSGCIRNPQVVTSDNAPSNAATSGSAFVFLDIHKRAGGLLGNAHVGVGALFVNTNAVPNPFYLRTPNSMKLGFGAYQKRWTLFKLDPGTYRLVSIGDGHDLYAFGMDESPVSFTVVAGELVFLGDVELDTQNLTGLNPFVRRRTRLSFDVSDDLDSIRSRIEPQIAELPGAPVLQTRLATILKPEMDVTADR
jgi:hypothetical protein